MSTDEEIRLLFQKANIANSNKKPFKCKKNILFAGVFTLILCSFFAVGSLFYNNYLPSNSYPHANTKQIISDVTISKQEKRTFKKLVRKIAQKENKHTNTIHAELRSRFNYRSYRYLNQQTYIKIKRYLITRLK